MRLKKLTLVFDKIASLSFYGPSKFFRFGDFEHFEHEFPAIIFFFSVVGFFCIKL